MGLLGSGGEGNLLQKSTSKRGPYWRGGNREGGGGLYRALTAGYSFTVSCKLFFFV